MCIDVFDTVKFSTPLLFIRLQAGSEEFAATRQSYVKKSEGVICVYSIDNLQSFQDVPKWFQEIRFDKHLSGIALSILDLWFGRFRFLSSSISRK